MSRMPFALRFGYSNGSTIEVVAHSLSSSNVSINVSGVGTTLFSAMAQLGTDSGSTANTEAMFYEAKTISGLSPLTQYSYTATQDGNTLTGTFYSAPTSEDSDFSFFAGTCDNIESLGGVPAGMYTHIRDYMENGALPTVGLLHVDDHYGYMDWNAADDGTHSVAGAAAYQSGEVYEYAVGASAALGLLDEGGNAYCTAGHNVDRQFVYNNLPVWPQKGDHDSGVDDMGWGVNPAGVGLPTTQYTNSKVVWDAILEPLQPPPVDGSNSEAWGFAVGPVYIAAVDAITNGTGDGSSSAAPTTVLGTTQIDSVLTAMDNTSPFKILGMANGIRYLSATKTNQNGAQYPLSLHAAEYARLFTASGNPTKSLMDNDNTNGVNGTMLVVLGDYHGLKFQYNKKAGTLNEWFYSINLGTLTGATNFKVVPATTEYDGSTVEYSDGPAVHATTNDYWCVRFDVYGSRYPKELHAVAIDKNGDEVFSRKFVHRITMNDGVPVSTATFDKKVSMSGTDGFE